MSKYKISYDGWSEDASPIKSDVKIKVSHNKLVSQKQNAIARGEWGRKNHDKSHEIAKKGGNKTLSLGTGIHALSMEQMSEHGKKNYREGKGFAKLTKKERSTIGKQYGKLNLVTELICEKCGRKTNKGNYAKVHGTKCREKDKIKILNKLPNKFTKGMLKEVAERLDITDWNKLNILHPTCPYTKCIIKVDKPNQYNPCWYGKNLREINKVKK
jgi:hypothetical protein